MEELRPKMKLKFNDVLLAGILICLLIIAFRTAPQKPVQPASFPSSINLNSGETVVQLTTNRIAVIDNKSNSGMYGTVLVFDFDKTKKTFNFVGSFNYSDYFRNPQKYEITN